MARPQAISIENKFIKGLITENSALNFPKDACTETWDCVFDYTGRVTRRLGIDLEEGYVTTNTITEGSTDAWTEFIWSNVGGDASQAFLVQQQGDTLRFFDITDDTSVGVGIESHTVDLNTYLPTGTSFTPESYSCQYAQGRGKLVVVNEACDPFFVSYEVSSGIFTETEITLQARDFEGLDDGLTISERPTATVAGIKTSNPEHYYNLLNQGWSITGALAQWDTARSDLPSNADMIAYYRVDASDEFSDSRVTSNDPGNSPAIRGHFILTVGENDRNAAMTDGGFTGATVSGGGALISRSAGSVIGDMSSTSFAFNGVTSANASNSATKASGNTAYMGKDWGVGVTQTPGRVLVYPSTDGTLISSYTGDVKIDVYGKATAPANATDGTLLGTLTAVDSTSPHEITITDQSTAYRYHWVTIQRDPTPASSVYYVAELQFYEAVGSFQRPRTVSFFAGRAWYAGIDSQQESGKIFFTQIIQEDSDYGKCYQENDPTSEQLADLLDNDGGVIRIPEIGKVEKLFPFQAQLIVYASNGIWAIKGGSAGFKATDYAVRRLTNVGTFSPLSVVDVKGIPVWWGEDGIYTASYDPNFDSTTVQNLSEESIKTFFDAIPSLNRRYVKGTYDRLEDKVLWVYNSDSSLASTDYYIYNKVLNFDTKTTAFYPWTIGITGNNSPDVRGITYIQDGQRVDTAYIKFPITYTISATKYLNFAEPADTGYKDWITYGASVTAHADDDVDYSSYFVTGYEIDAELMKFAQANYVSIFLEQTADSSAFMRALWDFSNSSSSGKWSTAQQIYNSATTKGRSYRSINHRRLKVRGKGKALQFRVYSETGKPFTIIGWASWKTSNEGI